MGEYDISIRHVGHVDDALAARCGEIVGEFLGYGQQFAWSVRYDVNVMGRTMFVAENGADNVCGFVIGNLREGPGRGRITYLYVSGAIHNRGVGTCLLSRLEDKMRAVGITRVDVLSRPWAVPFYRARGYIRDHLQLDRLQKSL